MAEPERRVVALDVVWIQLGEAVEDLVVAPLVSGVHELLVVPLQGMVEMSIAGAPVPRTASLARSIDSRADDCGVHGVVRTVHLTMLEEKIGGHVSEWNETFRE